MNNKIGEVFFRDIHGNFHKLNTKDFNEELAEITNFENIINISEYEQSICNYKPYNYYRLCLENIKNCNINNNQLSLEKGLYKFSVYLNISTEYSQRFYFFLREKKIISSSLQTKYIYNNIPNNININFIIRNNKKSSYDFAIITEKDIDNIDIYILYTKISK